MERSHVSRPWHLRVNVIAASGLVTMETRVRMLRRAGIDLRTNSIRLGCFFGTANVSIGEGSMIGARCLFHADGPIRIGRDCWIASDVAFVTATHDIGPPERRAGPMRHGEITVGDGCWIGTRATILPDIAIASGCLIAAGSVVTEDCEPDTLYAGVPATAKARC